jgi:hypothetical protein
MKHTVMSYVRQLYVLLTFLNTNSYAFLFISKKTGKAYSIFEYTQFPHAFFTNSEFWVLQAEVKNALSRIYYAGVTTGVVHISITVDSKQCKNISPSLQQKFYSSTLTNVSNY